MSLDRSLKTEGNLVQHRNVLKRAERIERLKENRTYDEAKPVIGLPKTANRKAGVGG